MKKYTNKTLTNSLNDIVTCTSFLSAQAITQADSYANGKRLNQKIEKYKDDTGKTHKNCSVIFDITRCPCCVGGGLELFGHVLNRKGTKVDQVSMLIPEDVLDEVSSEVDFCLNCAFLPTS